MRIVVLVPSEDYVGNAGARIRYSRLSPALGELGVSLSLKAIGTFDSTAADCDAVIISKCTDARALVAATILSDRGIVVGVDLFDDYFSQVTDSRLNRHRHWLAQLLPLCSFAMCSTAPMANIVKAYRADLPVHVLNDPGPAIDLARLREQLLEKRSDAVATGQIRLGWFGIGDNPQFPVGISDLASYAGAISTLSAGRFAVELSILTNVRALDAERLAMISSLPVIATIDEWSEEREADLLRKSLVCLLPVNAQSFSTAKSLNRAVTALSSGAQVLSLGYPLYAPFDAFIYRDPVEVLDDLSAGELRLSNASLDRFCDRLDEMASTSREAKALVAFLQTVKSILGPRRPIYLIHGASTNGAAHKAVQAVGGLSVATPFCTAQLGFDIYFRTNAVSSFSVLVSDKAMGRMNAEFRIRATPHDPINKRKFWQIDCGGINRNDPARSAPPLALQLAQYSLLMRRVAETLEAAFGPGRAIISETSSLPFEASL